MTNFTKILGIPGSGKTRTLIETLEGLIDKGEADINSMCFTTFSKTTGMKIRARIAETYGLELKDLLYYGTIHSVCFKLLDWSNIEELQVVNDVDKNDYLSEYGLTHPIEQASDIANAEPEMAISEGLSAGMRDGEKIFALINWCNNRLLPLKHWRDTGIIFDYVDPSIVLEICKGWDEYKHEKCLVDFDDMLLEVIKKDLSPDIKNLFVDEFQDMTPLLSGVVSLWSKNKENVFVGGDPNQAIYPWSGASPKFLLDFSADEIILHDSYRVPSEILKRAENLISTTEDRLYTHFHAVKKGGQFIHLHSPSFDDLLKYFPDDYEKDVFFLFRTNYLANIFCINYLIPSGIPYAPVKPTSKIYDVWRYYRIEGHKLLETRSAMSKIQRNVALTQSEVGRLLKMLPSCSKKRVDGYVRYGKKTWFKKNPRPAWSVKEILQELLVKLPEWDSHWVLSDFNDLQRSAYVANIQLHPLLLPHHVRVGTLHSSKGLESDVVFVFNTHTKIVDDHLTENGRVASDDETRLYYVGITRAMERCVLVDDFAEFPDKYVFDLEGLI